MRSWLQKEPMEILSKGPEENVDLQTTNIPNIKTEATKSSKKKRKDLKRKQNPPKLKPEKHESNEKATKPVIGKAWIVYIHGEKREQTGYLGLKGNLFGFVILCICIFYI